MSAKTIQNLLILSVVLNALFLGVMLFKVYPTPEEAPYVETYSSDPAPVVATSSVTFTNLPEDIHPGQIYKLLGDDFALVQRRSFNQPLLHLPIEAKADWAGVLRWNEDSKRWEKFLAISSTNPDSSSKNNPIDFWWGGYMDTDQIPHLVVADSNGGGSGDGIAKELVADNIGLTEWKVVDCYEYAVDLGKGKKMNLSDEYCQNAKITPVQ